MVHREPPGRFEKACYTLLAGSVVLAGVTAGRLVTESSLPVASASPGAISAPSLRERRTAAPASALGVVAADPFHVDRTAPASRYLLPVDDLAASVSGPGSLREGAVRLLGTAVLGSGGGFVMCQVGSATPEVVRIGQVVGGLTLRSITRGEAEFTRPDGSLVTLSVPTAVASPGREPQPR
jgi:hypothetical protein